MRRARAAFAGLFGLLAVEVAAQEAAAPRQQKTLDLERELGRRQQDLIVKSGAAERWMDLLVRYHLGLPVEMAEICGLSTEEKVGAQTDLEQQLAESLDAVARASTRLEQRQSQLSATRQAVLERPATPTGQLNPSVESLEPPDADDPHRPLTVPEDAEDTEGAAAGSLEPAPEPAPPPVLIRGAIDPLHRGVAFFMAGQHDKAVAALEQATAATQPPPLALFYLARAYEKRGDVARADGLYLQIEAQAGDREAGAAWTAAARTARQHMNWMRDHGKWQLPPIPRESAK